MHIQPADLAQPGAEMTLNAPGPVPILDAALAENAPDRRHGFWPLVAVVVAFIATLAWNGFLLWEGAMLVLGWIGPT